MEQYVYDLISNEIYDWILKIDFNLYACTHIELDLTPLSDILIGTTMISHFAIWYGIELNESVSLNTT